MLQLSITQMTRLFNRRFPECVRSEDAIRAKLKKFRQKDVRNWLSLVAELVLWRPHLYLSCRRALLIIHHNIQTSSIAVQYYFYFQCTITFRSLIILTKEKMNDPALGESERAAIKSYLEKHIESFDLILRQQFLAERLLKDDQRFLEELSTWIVLTVGRHCLHYHKRRAWKTADSLSVGYP